MTAATCIATAVSSTARMWSACASWTPLRFHRYRVVGNPYWVGGRYVVRTHDRFGRVVFVQVDPWSGAFIREVIL